MQRRSERSATPRPPATRKVISDNRRARHDYDILETVEAGLALMGSEVKSLRAGKASLAEAHVRIEGGEAWLVDAHIGAYEPASRFGHEPRRRRKLLLHKAEIDKWERKVVERGLTVVPLKLVFSGPRAKVEIALARGRKLYDKRRAIREREDAREVERATRRR